MTFNNAAWAIDGARITGALARLAAYATGGGRSGVVKPSDLKVSPLAVPGNGLRISSGGANVLNYYQADPDEAYVVSNAGVHTVLSADMPAPVPATAYYLVCVVVGDPEFDQTGHPYMPTTIAPEDAPDFEYVRVVVVPCSAGTTHFEELGLDYPAYALARLEIPASTTTITSEMIIDVRELAQPRSERVVLTGQPSTGLNLTQADVFHPTGLWTDYTPSIDVPSWATKVDVVAHIASALHVDPEVQGQIAVKLGSTQGPGISYAFDDTDSAGGAERVSLLAPMTADVSGVAGTTQILGITGYKLSAYAGYLSTYSGMVIVFDVQFSESVI